MASTISGLGLRGRCPSYERSANYRATAKTQGLEGYQITAGSPLAGTPRMYSLSPILVSPLNNLENDDPNPEVLTHDSFHKWGDPKKGIQNLGKP